MHWIVQKTQIEAGEHTRYTLDCVFAHPVATKKYSTQPNVVDSCELFGFHICFKTRPARKKPSTMSAIRTVTALFVCICALVFVWSRKCITKQDVGSKFKTLVNGLDVLEANREASLKDGDLVKFGNTCQVR